MSKTSQLWQDKLERAQEWFLLGKISETDFAESLEELGFPPDEIADQISTGRELRGGK